MNTKIAILLSAILFSLHVIGQENTSKFDFRLGAGISLQGTGDMRTFNYENEVNYQLNRYFTSSISINLGRSNYGGFETSSFVQGNLNIFISPFKNNKQFDFRLGTGITYYNVNDAYALSKLWVNGVLVDADYGFEKRNSFGFNLIIENTYLLTDKFMVGLKLFTQPYLNGDINSGAMLKLGFKI